MFWHGHLGRKGVSSKPRRVGKSVASPVGSVASVSSPPPISTTLEFYIDDFGRTLFPLNTNRVLIESGEAEIKEYIRKCLDNSRTGVIRLRPVASLWGQTRTISRDEL